MNTDSTTITYEKTRNDAKTVAECAREMDRIFQEFEDTMKQVGGEEVFVGDANESLQNRFSKLKQRFPEFVKTVLQFSELITGAAESEEKTEAKLSQAADALASNEKEG